MIDPVERLDWSGSGVMNTRGTYIVCPMGFFIVKNCVNEVIS
jgi:hypothetical protein